MCKDDFILNRVENKDYWFDISGETKKELTEKYFEQGMLEVSEVVYSFEDDQWGIKREFIFNYDVITPKDKELYKFIKSIAEKYVKENK